MLHAFKYPHAAVCGLLVGKPAGLAARRRRSASMLRTFDPCCPQYPGSLIAVEHAVPLAHGRITLAPMVEIALAQVRKTALPDVDRATSSCDI